MIIYIYVYSKGYVIYQCLCIIRNDVISLKKNVNKVFSSILENIEIYDRLDRTKNETEIIVKNNVVLLLVEIRENLYLRYIQ